MPICAIENTLGTPLNQEVGLKGWEGLDVYTTDGKKLNCSSAYLEQFDLGTDGRVYQITCFVNDRDQYESLFSHHVEGYDKTFN